MTVEQIEKLENELMFKMFLRRIWFHSLMEYYKLFMNDLEKRQTAVERYLDTYKNIKHES